MPYRSWAHAAIRSDALARVIAWRAAHSATSSHQRSRTRQTILWLNAVDDDKGRLGVTPEQLQALIAQLTARANNEHDAAEVPGSPSARRFETHARHHLETKLASELIAHHAEDIARRAAAAELPADLVILVYRLLKSEPELSWDQALARIIG